MEHRTRTYISSLRIGDIFHYPGKDEKHIVTGQGRNFTSVNKPSPDGGRKHKYDGQVTGTRRVIFLRHTVPQPGEACLLGDLKNGDIFHLSTDPISEFIKVNGCVYGRQHDQRVPPLTAASQVVFIENIK